MQSKVGTLKLVKGLTYTPRTIVHQSVTNENFGNILSAIKLKYLSRSSDNSKTKSFNYYHEMHVTYLASIQKADIQLWAHTRNTYWWWIQRCWKCIRKPSKWWESSVRDDPTKDRQIRNICKQVWPMVYQKRDRPIKKRRYGKCSSTIVILCSA